jgi:hypothetical protein
MMAKPALLHLFAVLCGCDYSRRVIRVMFLDHLGYLDCLHGTCGAFCMGGGGTAATAVHPPVQCQTCLQLHCLQIRFDWSCC